MKAATLVATAALVMLSACGQVSPKMQADTPERFHKSLRKYATTGEGLPSRERSVLTTSIRDLYLTADGKQWKDPGEVLSTVPAEQFHLLRQADFPRLAKRALGQTTDNDELYRLEPVDPTNPLTLYWVNDFFLKQLKAQQGVLLQRKERSRQADLFTIDQIAFADAAFIPPQEGQPIAQDYAKFTVKMLNNTMFNLYRPSFRVSVSDSRSPLPIIDLVLSHPDDEPIVPGKVTQVMLQCCDGFRAERVNAMLRTLQPGAKTSMTLVGIEDFRKRNLIEKVLFTADQHMKLVATERCIKEVESRMDSWVPEESMGACNGI